jgi:class 3 adenylate cyclase
VGCFDLGEKLVTTFKAQAERAEVLDERGVPQVEQCPTCGADVPEGFRFCGQCGRALAAALAPIPGNLVTIVFTDLEGFTTFASRAEQPAVRDLILTYHGLVRQQVSSHGGFEVKQTGDGFMIAFSSAARAVLCAADIQRAMAPQNQDHIGHQTRVRVGLNSGDAIREGDDFFGHMVNIASRIAGRAVGGQVLVSEATRIAAGHVEGVQFVDIGRRRLRGVRGRHRFYEVLWWE